MRKWIHNIIFSLNLVAAVTLLLSYILPYVPPKTFPLISVLSLAVPILIIINLIFCLYWGVFFNKKILLSLVVLGIGMSHLTSLYEFNHIKETSINKPAISFFNYNVRSFNRFEWIDIPDIPHKISALVKSEDPTIFCAQEFFHHPDVNFKQYPYEYYNYNNDNGEIALVIFSKYPIVTSGSLNFKHTANNAIYADIALPKDTIRVYNIHLQSHKLSSKIRNLEILDTGEPEKFMKRMQTTFKKQQEQVTQILKHMQASSYPTFVMGDFNNTAYSYSYHQFINNGFKDTFKEAGNGFGKTFNFRWFPARIDFILTPEMSKILEHKNFEVEFSDHYPNFAKVELH